VKITTVGVNSCDYCPHGRETRRTICGWRCRKANKFLEQSDYPIPDWCPLPDGTSEKYYVIRKQLEEVTDDLAVDRITVDGVNIGEERWILNSFEKREGYVLGAELDDIDKDGVVVVIRGQVVTEDEVDLKREGAQDGTDQEEKIHEEELRQES